MPLRLRSLRQRLVWLLAPLLGVCVSVVPPVVAQIPGLPPGVRPSPEQARQILQTRPDLVQQLRERIQASGLTPDQVRARLQAEGYPPDLLDPYLPGFATTGPVTPSPNTLEAVRALGILSAETVDTLARGDSLRAMSDSVRHVVDSLALARLDSMRQDSLADSIAARGGRLKLFGLDVFRRASTRFQAVQTGPVDEHYRLGAGDVLVLILTGDVELTQTLEVNREGFIFIPQVGQVYVANLTLEQLEIQLYGRLGRVYSGVRRGPSARTRFSVTVARLRSLQVAVIGDVVRPGQYQVSAAGTVLTGLYSAGGPSENGSFRRIEVRRGQSLIDTVDAYDYLLRGLVPTDVRLASGDVIFVPVRRGLVRVSGRVVRPAIYEVRSGETLRDVIGFAGGFDASAVQNRIQIHRILPPAPGPAIGRERVVLEVAGAELAAGVIPGMPVVAGDSIVVFETARPARDYVTVRGNVWVPGRVGFEPGMKLSEALRLAGGPKPDVYLERVLVSRLRSDSTRVQLRASLADSTGAVGRDLALEPEDDIQVFSRSTFRARPYVTIVGGVQRSGRVPFREGMTLRDAVLLADGLAEDAAPGGAEIARLKPDRPTGALAETIRVPLDSSYFFRSAGGTGPQADDPVLQPYDNVLIPRQGGWDVQRLVAITGQVNAPGRYALTSKTERLATLLGRAGGLTNEAYVGGIQFYRRGGPGPRDSLRPASDTLSGLQPLPAGFRERVGIDLTRALKDSTYRDNLILAAGDSIHIPEFDPVVVVRGAVNAPGPVAYTPGKNLDWYVSAAGGYSQQADRRRPYVTQPDGRKQATVRRFLLADDLPKPRAGADVFVPQRIVSEQPSNAPAILGVVASVLASLTTIIIVTTR
ncbi:MAG: SLBB domain-containing protein [Gemmatimonadales bacterium]